MVVLSSADARRSRGLRLWWEVLKKLVNSAFQFLYVLVGLIGKRVGSGPSPNQILALGVEKIDDESTCLVGFRGRS